MYLLQAKKCVSKFKGQQIKIMFWQLFPGAPAGSPATRAENCRLENSKTNGNRVNHGLR